MSLRSRPALHHDPPLTPAGVLLGRRWPVPVLLIAFGALAVVAGVDDGRLLATLDEPVTRTLIDWRSGPLDGVVKTISALGGLTVVTAVLVVVLLVVWHECRALAWTLLAASAARPALEWALKELVGRDRPDLGRLVPGNGPSFPSGHVMAAIAIWGLLPPVVALVSGRPPSQCNVRSSSAAATPGSAFTASCRRNAENAGQPHGGGEGPGDLEAVGAVPWMLGAAVS